VWRWYVTSLFLIADNALRRATVVIFLRKSADRHRRQRNADLSGPAANTIAVSHTYDVAISTCNPFGFLDAIVDCNVNYDSVWYGIYEPDPASYTARHPRLDAHFYSNIVVFWVPECVSATDSHGNLHAYDDLHVVFHWLGDTTIYVDVDANVQQHADAQQLNFRHTDNHGHCQRHADTYAHCYKHCYSNAHCVADTNSYLDTNAIDIRYEHCDALTDGHSFAHIHDFRDFNAHWDTHGVNHPHWNVVEQSQLIWFFNDNADFNTHSHQVAHLQLDEEPVVVRVGNALRFVLTVDVCLRVGLPHR